MMTEPPLTAPAAPTAVQPAPLSRTAAITTFGTLAWLGWVWAIAGVVYTAILVIDGAGDDGDTSIWQGAAADWQRYTVLAAGAAMVPIYAPMLIGNGVTRAQISRSAAVTMAALAALAGALITAGFAAEHVVYDSQEAWRHRLAGGRAIDWGTIPQLGVAYAVTIAAYFVAGWIVGIGWHRDRWIGAATHLVPAAVPVAVAEGVVMGETMGGRPHYLTEILDGPLAVGVLITLVVIGAALALARHLTRDVAVH
jgi:hypothetical protein